MMVGLLAASRKTPVSIQFRHLAGDSAPACLKNVSKKPDVSKAVLLPDPAGAVWR